MKLLKSLPATRWLVILYWVCVLILAGILLFGYLDWGEEFLFHPDERNIARASLSVEWFSDLNPNFFAYGGFPIYLYSAGTTILKVVGLADKNLLTVVLLGRYVSALAILTTAFLVYRVAKLVFNRGTAYIGFLLTITTVGLVQVAHFATTEALLSMFMMLVVYLSLRYVKQPRLKWVVWLGIGLGLAIATKVVALLMIVPALLAIVLGSRWGRRKNIKMWWWRSLLMIGLAGLVFVLFNPYAILDYPAFRHSMNYESGVGLGKPLVFYTRQFIETVPVLFQFHRVLPFVLGPVLYILSLVGLVWAIWEVLDKRVSKFRRKSLLIVLVAFLAYFLPNAMMFAKWTRFIAPAFALLVVLSLLPISYLCQTNKKTPKKWAAIFLVFICLATSLWAGAFWQIYRKEDVRFRASRQMIKLKAGEANFLNESGNVVDLPLVPRGESFAGQVKSFDFYQLDQAPEHLNELVEKLVWADYYVVGSRRVWYNHIRLDEEYPMVADFYRKLFAGELGFEKVAEFASYPSLLGLQLPDEEAEETFTVFDHPKIQLYRKTRLGMRMTLYDYLQLLEPIDLLEVYEE